MVECIYFHFSKPFCKNVFSWNNANCIFLNNGRLKKKKVTYNLRPVCLCVKYFLVCFINNLAEQNFF